MSYEDFYLSMFRRQHFPYIGANHTIFSSAPQMTSELTIISSDHTFSSFKFFKYFGSCHGLKLFFHLKKRTSCEGSVGKNLPYCSSNKKLSSKFWPNNHVTFFFLLFYIKVLLLSTSLFFSLPTFLKLNLFYRVLVIDE